MKTLEPEQWRIMGTLISLCGTRAKLHETMKQQDVSPESVCDLVERGLVVAKLNGEDIDLTPGLIKTYRRKISLNLTRAGESYQWSDPHRVLRSPGRSRHGVSLTFMLGMVLFDDLVELAREGLVYALTEDDTIDLASAHQKWAGSSKVVLPGGAEVWTNQVIVRTTKAGQLYVERY
jgi:hypothetical protein